MRRLIVLLFTLVALAGGAVSCGPGPAPTPAPTPMPTLVPTPTSVPVHTLCLEVEQYYPEIEEEFSLPIAYDVECILTGLGFQVVGEGASCDATLTITLTGEALGASYAAIGETGSYYEYCYTGAQVNGQMTFTLPGRAPLTLPIIRSKGPTSGPIVSCPGKNGAPFGSVWLEAVLDGLAQLWPPQVFIRALGDEDWYVRLAAAEALGRIGPEEGVIPALIQALGDGNGDVRHAAAEALGRIGPEEGVIPALIQALRDEDWYVRLAAAEALGEITGQDFGEDADAWQGWWEDQE